MAHSKQQSKGLQNVLYSYRKFYSIFYQLTEIAQWDISPNSTYGFNNISDDDPTLYNIITEEPIHITAILRGQQVDLLIDTKDTFKRDGDKIVASKAQVIYFQEKRVAPKLVVVQPTLSLHFDFACENFQYHPLFHFQLRHTKHDENLFKKIDKYRDDTEVDTCLVLGQNGLECVRFPTAHMNAISTILSICADFAEGVEGNKPEFLNLFNQLIKLHSDFNFQTAFHKEITDRIQNTFSSAAWYLGHPF